MPPVDVETLASSCIGGYSDRKVSCETLAKDDGGGGGYLPDDDDNDFAVTDVPPDFPPESFWLSKDAEIDWFDRNAFLERKESGKGISNSTNLNTNSQRFSKNSKSKASIIGLPKTQQNYLDSKRRTNRPASIHLFPKRSESTGKSTVSVNNEPSSPKVSCMGRVRSKRYRRNSSINKKKREKSAHKSRTGTSDDKRKKSFYSKVLSIFNTGGGDKSRTARPEVKITKDEITTRKSTSSMRMREFPVGTGTEPVTEPPTLGGMKKLVSGRRSSSGTTEDFDVATLIQSEMLGPTKRI